MQDPESVLRVFLASYRDIVSAPHLEGKLTALAEALVRARLFRRAAVQLYAECYGEKLFGVAGLTPEEASWIRSHDVLVEEEYRRVQQYAIQLEEVYFIPHDRLRMVLPNLDDVLLSDALAEAEPWQEGQWHPDDMVYMPLTSSAGQALGNITADGPFDHQVPTTATAALLAPFVAMAAATVEQELSRRRDYLTQCFNGQFFRDEVDRRLSTPGRRLGLVFLDMNGLKAVNDELGHEAGDRAIQETARALAEAVRQLTGPWMQDPVVCRLYGDEFGVLFQPGEGADPRTLGERLVQCWPAGVPRAAVGVAVREDGDDARTLVRRAERAMYEAKAVMHRAEASRATDWAEGRT